MATCPVCYSEEADYDGKGYYCWQCEDYIPEDGSQDTPTDTPQPAPQSPTSGQQGSDEPKIPKGTSADRIPVNRNRINQKGA